MPIVVVACSSSRRNRATPYSSRCLAWVKYRAASTIGSGSVQKEAPAASASAKRTASRPRAGTHRAVGCPRGAAARASPNNATGLRAPNTQLQLATARFYDSGLTEEKLLDRDTNLRLGFRFLKELMGQFDNNMHLALLAYNRGPGKVAEILAEGGDPKNGYSDAVLKGYRPPHTVAAQTGWR